VEAAAFLDWEAVAVEEDRVEPHDQEEAASIPEGAWEVEAFRQVMEAPESVQMESQAVEGQHLEEAQIAVGHHILRNLEEVGHRNLQNQAVAVLACLEVDQEGPVADQHSSGGPEEEAYPFQVDSAVAASRAVDAVVDPEAFPCHHFAASVGDAAFLVAVQEEAAYPFAKVAAA